jgi:hypothetical protein
MGICGGMGMATGIAPGGGYAMGTAATGCGGMGRGGKADVTTAMGTGAVTGIAAPFAETGVPHLTQKCSLASTGAPQLLQNFISFSPCNAEC